MTQRATVGGPAPDHDGADRRLDLIPPSARYAESFRAHVQEFRDRGEKLVPFTLSFANEPVEELLQKFARCARGDGIPPGFVPHSTFWLVEGHEVVGVSNVRHGLTDALRKEGGNIGYGVRPSCRGQGIARVLLRRTLDEARLLGLREVWLTCAKTNIPSVRTIVGNGGLLASEEWMEHRAEVVQRYTIDLAAGNRSPRAL